MPKRSTNSTTLDGQFSGSYKKETSSLFSAGQEGPSSGDVRRRRVRVPKRSWRKSREGRIKFPWTFDYTLTLKNSSERPTLTFHSSSISHRRAQISANDSRFVPRRLVDIPGGRWVHEFFLQTALSSARQEADPFGGQRIKTTLSLLLLRITARNGIWLSASKSSILYTPSF